MKQRNKVGYFFLCYFLFIFYLPLVSCPGKGHTSLEFTCVPVCIRVSRFQAGVICMLAWISPSEPLSSASRSSSLTTNRDIQSLQKCCLGLPCSQMLLSFFMYRKFPKYYIIHFLGHKKERSQDHTVGPRNLLVTSDEYHLALHWVFSLKNGLFFYVGPFSQVDHKPTCVKLASMCMKTTEMYVESFQHSNLMDAIQFLPSEIQKWMTWSIIFLGLHRAVQSCGKYKQLRHKVNARRPSSEVPQ